MTALSTTASTITARTINALDRKLDKQAKDAHHSGEYVSTSWRVGRFSTHASDAGVYVAQTYDSADMGFAEDEQWVQDAMRGDRCKSISRTLDLVPQDHPLYDALIDDVKTERDFWNS